MRSFLALLLWSFTLLPWTASAAGPSAAGADRLRPWTGGATPALALKDPEGRLHRLDDHRGKVVLVNFWATWCVPCREEMPSMNRLRQSLAGQPFEVLAVNLGESESRIRRFAGEWSMEFPALLDRDSAVARAWGARMLPMSFIVGPDGRIRYSVLGELDWSSDAARRAITALLPPKGKGS